MITGGHVVLFSTDADADRAFFRDVLEFPNVDAGGGWLIFRLPPSEAAFHPSESDSRHELYFTTDDVEAEVERLTAAGVACGPIKDEGWGRVTAITLPGGGELGLYQPAHAVAFE